MCRFGDVGRHTDLGIGGVLVTPKTETKIATAWCWIILFPHLIWNGVILMLMWNWFVAPLGLPQIGIAHAIALGLLPFVISGKLRGDGNITWEKLGEDWLGDVILLLMGFVLSFFL